LRNTATAIPFGQIGFKPQFGLITVRPAASFRHFPQIPEKLHYPVARAGQPALIGGYGKESVKAGLGAGIKVQPWAARLVKIARVVIPLNMTSGIRDRSLRPDAPA
jgi:hypothetical protein